MRIAYPRTAALSLLLGAAAGVLTAHFNTLMASALATNVAAVRWAYVLPQTLAVPGVLAAMLLGFRLSAWQAIAISVLFWLGFTWLFGFLVNKLRQQIRLLASHF